jgi:hypothetical protein
MRNKKKIVFSEASLGFAKKKQVTVLVRNESLVVKCAGSHFTD